MTQPMQDPNALLPQEGPVTGDMILALRREAMQKQGMQPDQSGAIDRRLGQNMEMGQAQSPEESLPHEDSSNPLSQGVSPTQIQLDDMESAQNAQIEPPDINQTAAKVMMQYGAVLQFLEAAKGQIQQ